MNINEKAVEKIKEYNVDSMPYFRIAVQPGGCSGLKYEMYFESEKSENDHISQLDGFSLLIDPASFPYLVDAKLNYFDSIERQGFTVDNPNEKSSCACGNSFC